MNDKQQTTNNKWQATIIIQHFSAQDMKQIWVMETVVMATWVATR